MDYRQIPCSLKLCLKSLSSFMTPPHLSLPRKESDSCLIQALPVQDSYSGKTTIKQRSIIRVFHDNLSVLAYRMNELLTCWAVRR